MRSSSGRGWGCEGGGGVKRCEASQVFANKRSNKACALENKAGIPISTDLVKATKKFRMYVRLAKLKAMEVTDLDPQFREYIRIIAENSAKLLYEVQRLQRDVILVRDRIEPYENDKKLKFPSFEPRKTKWKLKEALNMIDEARRRIEGIERDVGNCLGILKGIESDAISREEMKPYLGQNRKTEPF
jgi:hypothetical protein